MYDEDVVASARLVMAGKQDQATHVFTRFADAEPAGWRASGGSTIAR